jgi:hypothetical protein
MKQTYLVSGVQVVFDPEEKIHGDRYKTIEGKRFTGVTTALNAISKPPLLEWAAKMAYEDVVNGADAVECLKSKNYAHRRKSDDAKDKGHDVHKDFEVWNIENEMVQKVDAFFQEQGIKILAKEYPVFSIKYWYAGTFDAIVEWKGKRYIVDWKTSSGVYGREYFAQCSAYLNGFKETYPDKEQPVGYLIIRVDKNKNTFDTTINKTDKKGNLSTYGNVFFVENPSLVKSDFQYFLFCLGVYRQGLVDYFEEVEPIINIYK